jgi:hypothetical protein
MYERTTWPRAARFGGVAEIYREIREQLVAARLAVVTGFVLAAVLLGAVVFIHFWRGTSFAAFMRDPAAHVGAPAYVGAISHIGIIMWAAAAAICLFSAWTIWRAGWRARQHSAQSSERDREDVRFLAWSGLGTLYLALDDVMLLHVDIYHHQADRVVRGNHSGRLFCRLCALSRPVSSRHPGGGICAFSDCPLLPGAYGRAGCSAALQ